MSEEKKDKIILSEDIISNKIEEQDIVDFELSEDVDVVFKNEERDITISDVFSVVSENDFIVHLIEKVDSGNFYPLPILRNILFERLKKLQ